MYDKIEGFADIFGGVTQSVETRLSKILGDVEHHACLTVMNGEILVFGHTHHPFINEAENVVNSGCWVADSSVNNTVVELSGGRPRLSIFEEREITGRLLFSLVLVALLAALRLFWYSESHPISPHKLVG